MMLQYPLIWPKLGIFTGIGLLLWLVTHLYLKLRSCRQEIERLLKKLEDDEHDPGA